MRFIIDEDVCTKEGITLQELLALLLIKTGANINEILSELSIKEALVKDVISGKLLITSRWSDKVSEVLLDSENIGLPSDKMDSLVNELMKIFDKGKKDGKYWFKGNRRDISLRLKKFFKLYGDRYSDEDIIKAAKAYVESFNGDYRYMRLLKYFIWKDQKKEGSDGKIYIEEISELATYLDNLDSDNNENYGDWTSELR